MSISRADVVALAAELVANDHLRRHMLATEAIMHALALRLGGDPDEWALAGLGHDLDVEQTEDDFTRHGQIAADLLRERGAGEAVSHAVAAHNPMTGVAADDGMSIALIAADQLSGLITAAALVRPDKSLVGVQAKSVRKRFKETAFARGVERESILRCEELGVPLDEFIEIGLAAMQGVALGLGLA
jgi:putative nucleotidyltransferase with HDIG domain